MELREHAVTKSSSPATDRTTSSRCLTVVRQRGRGDRHAAVRRQHGRGHLDGVQPLSAYIAHDDAYSGVGLDHLVEVAPDERFVRGRDVAGGETQ